MKIIVFLLMSHSLLYLGGCREIESGEVQNVEDVEIFPEKDVEIFSKSVRVKVHEGQNAKFPCSFNNSQGTFIPIWKHYEDTLFIGRRRMNSNPRLDFSSLDNSLAITDVALEDAGEYACIISSKPLKKFAYTLEVKDVPVVLRLHIILSRKHIRAHEGQDVKFPCGYDTPPPQDTGYDTPQGDYMPIWKHDEDVLFTGMLQWNSNPRLNVSSLDNSLTIAGVTTEDAGEYICVMSKDPSIRSVHTLEVGDAPEIINRNDSVIVTEEGERVTILCNTHGQPSPRISWSLEDKSLLPDVVVENETIIIENVTRHHADEYFCTAENQFGKAVQGFKLIVNYRPVVTDAKAIQLTRLVCNVHAFPLPTVSFYHPNDSKILPSYKYQIIESPPKYILEITNVTSDDYGWYLCHARNEFGVQSALLNLSDDGSTFIFHTLQEEMPGNDDIPLPI